MWIPNTKKHSQAHFQGCYQTPKNKIVFQKIFSEKWIIFQKMLMPKQTEPKIKLINKKHVDHM